MDVLEESDSQPASYWTCLITALPAVVPGAGAGALQLLQSGQPPIETVLTVLNELGAAPSDLHLVLDDYHLVDGPDIQDGTVPRGTARHVRGDEPDRLRARRPGCRRPAPAARQELGEHTWLPQNPYRWRVAMARVRAAEGDLDGALDLVEEAQRVYTGGFSPNVRPIPALRARLLATHGRVGEALAWAREQGLSADDDPTYLRESEAAIDAAARLLERLLQAAEAGERTGSAIELLVLRALTDHARGDVPGALAALERALTLAEPEGYVRMFTGEGPPMASLLRRVVRQRTGWDHLRRLPSAASHAEPAGKRLVEPLSDRELDVLRLLGSDLGGPDIARELTVSLNTLRTHTSNI